MRHCGLYYCMWKHIFNSNKRIHKHWFVRFLLIVSATVVGKHKMPELIKCEVWRCHSPVATVSHWVLWELQSEALWFEKHQSFYIVSDLFTAHPLEKGTQIKASQCLSSHAQLSKQLQHVFFSALKSGLSFFWLSHHLVMWVENRSENATTYKIDIFCEDSDWIPWVYESLHFGATALGIKKTCKIINVQRFVTG